MLASIVTYRKPDRKRPSTLTTRRRLRLAVKQSPTILLWLAFLVHCVKAHGKLPLTRTPNENLLYSIRAATFGQSIFNGTTCGLSD